MYGLQKCLLFSKRRSFKKVIWTDFIQTIFMLVGAFYLMIKAILKVGGVESLINKFSYAIPSSTLYSNLSCGLPNHDYFNLLRDANSDFPWPGMSVGK